MQMNWSLVRSKYLHLRYQTYEVEEAPKIIYLHDDRIYDSYSWLEEDSGKRDTHLSFEEHTLQKYLHLNVRKNDWLKVRNLFRDASDYKLFQYIQHRNQYMFYSYMDFSSSIYKPIFYRTSSLKGVDPHVVLDSNKISGTVIEHEYSPNGAYCVFTIRNEDDPSFYMVVDVETGETYGRNLKFDEIYRNIVWSVDSKGFFVYYDPRRGDNPSIFYHYLDNRKQDVLIAAIKKSETETAWFQNSADYKYLILFESKTVSIANIELLDVKIELQVILRIFPDVTYDYVGNDGDNFLFLTNLDAPKHRIIEINISQENREWDSCNVIVAENYDKHGVLQSAFKYAAYLFLIYTEDFQSTFYLYSLEMKCIEFKIDVKDENFFCSTMDELGFYFETQSYETPQKIYRIDFIQLLNRPKDRNAYTILKPILKRETKVPSLYDAKFSIQHDSFNSFDGSNVPLTVIQKNSNDPNKPCLVFVYGGFGIPMLPLFKLFYLLFIELFNGIVVIIYIRGGGELGDDWLLKSSEVETSFNDLIAGVAYLKTKTYKNVIDPDKIAFLGISHGGLAGAVAINKRRDLFRAVILQNANFDLIHDLPHKNRLWEKQYGNLNKKEDYCHIKQYAPLLHIEKPKTHEEAYPTTLIVASRYDEVVDFANSLKYLAMRRAISVCNEFQQYNPILLKVINSGGHHYESSEKQEFLHTVFAKLQFLAEAMDLKFDEMYK